MRFFHHLIRSLDANLWDLLNPSYICDPFLSYANDLSVSEPDTADLVPSVLLQPNPINHQPSLSPLLALMDSGSTSVFINRKRLPKGCVPSLLQRNVHSQTAAGLFVVNSHVTLRDIILPEFGRSLKIESLHACVFDADCKYDIIVGRDFMAPNNFDIKFSTQSMEWYDCVVPMKPALLPDLYHLDFDNDVDDDDPFDCFPTEILPSKYEKVDVQTVVDQQTHLSPVQQTQLHDACHGLDELFNGKLGLYNRKQVHLDIKPNAVPIHCKPYAVPHAHKQIFNDEALRLVDQGVLAPVGASEHAYPTFITPKKDGRVRWVSDFRELNDMLVRKLTLCHALLTSLLAAMVTNSSPRLTSACNTILLNSMKNPLGSVSLLLLLANTVTFVFRWALRCLLTLLKK